MNMQHMFISTNIFGSATMPFHQAFGVRANFTAFLSLSLAD